MPAKIEKLPLEKITKLASDELKYQGPGKEARVAVDVHIRVGRRYHKEDMVAYQIGIIYSSRNRTGSDGTETTNLHGTDTVSTKRDKPNKDIAVLPSQEDYTRLETVLESRLNDFKEQLYSEGISLEVKEEPKGERKQYGYTLTPAYSREDIKEMFSDLACDDVALILDSQVYKEKEKFTKKDIVAIMDGVTVTPGYIVEHIQAFNAAKQKR